MAVIGGYPGQSVSGKTIVGRQSYQLRQEYPASGLTSTKAAPAVSSSTIWDASTAVPLLDWSVTNAGLTAERTGNSAGDGLIRTTVALTDGEAIITIDALMAAGFTVVGLSTLAETGLLGNLPNGESVGYYSTGGILFNGASVASATAWGVGDKIRIVKAGALISFYLWVSGAWSLQATVDVTGYNVAGSVYPTGDTYSGFATGAKFTGDFSGWGGGGGATAYSLTAAVGTFTYTGQSAGLLVGYDMVAANAAYTYTGQAAVLSYGRPMTAAAGTFTYTGQAAGLLIGLDLAAAGATYTYTGQDAVLSYGQPMAAAVGTFTYSGQAANLLTGLDLAAAGGTYSYTGQAAGLPIGLDLAAAAGVFTYNGQAATLQQGQGIVGSVGTFSYSGQAANLAVIASLAADAGIFSYTGEPATLFPTIHFTMPVTVGTFSYAGQSARGTLSLDTFPPMSVVSGVRVSAAFFR